MILNVSGRTDVVAYYTEWFMNRYQAGFLDVRNPFNPHLISRINFKNVDAIVFCTKNPLPILPYLDKIHKPIIFHVTITPYLKDIEPGVPDKTQIIEAVKKLSSIIDKDCLAIRYDPIFISPKYTLEYHINAFNKLCQLLDGYVNKVIISFMDEYKNVLENKDILKYRFLTSQDYQIIGKSFSKSAHAHNMTVQTCFEERDLTEYGFTKGDCIPHELAYILTGKKYPDWKARQGSKCHCVQMIDVGYYNSCPAHCRYCYASYDQKQITKNYQKHNPHSSLLIGKLEENDIIKERLK